MSPDPKDCQTVRGSWGSCIQALAAGWVLAGDLCPVCTQTFMRAIGAVVPNLDWHPMYRDRATSREEVSRG